MIYGPSVLLVVLVACFGASGTSLAAAVRLCPLHQPRYVLFVVLRYRTMAIAS